MKLKKIAALVLAGALCVSAFTGCGTSYDADEIVATLGEQDVTAGITNFLCKYQKVMMDDMYMAYFGEDMWSADMSGAGTTLEEDVKSSVMDSLHEMYTLKAHMADYGAELTEEEQKNISEAAAAFLAANSKEALEEMSASQEIVEEMLSLYTIRWKMYEAIIADTDREVSDEEANMRGYTLVSIGLQGEYDEDGNYTAYTEDEVAAIKEEAEKAALALVDKDLETIAEEYDYDIKTDAFAKDDATFDEDLLAKMNEMSAGEVSGLIETENTLYIVRIDSECDEEATEENRLAIIAERENALYEEVVLGWQKDDGWTVDEKVLADIEFHHILTGQKESTESESTESESTESESELTEETGDTQETEATEGE
uniref:peptidylprolyl isomerase n=1 Tax=Agathobacter sp. TaxID=2021311 RepID=UPI004055DC6D